MCANPIKHTLCSGYIYPQYRNDDERVGLTHIPKVTPPRFMMTEKGPRWASNIAVKSSTLTKSPVENSDFTSAMVGNRPAGGEHRVLGA